jgi:CRISPR-associated protein Cas2
MRILVVYDVNTESASGRRRLRRVAKACEGFGQRVQKSVFECDLQDGHYEKLRHDLRKIIDDAQDDLRIYRMAEATRVDHFGVNVQTDFRSPLII